MARLDANANNASRLRRNAQRHADTITSAVVVDSPLQNNGTSIGFASQTAHFVFIGPVSGGAATPTFRALITSDLPTGTGTVTSFSAGTLSPLFTTSVATATTTPALTFAITNQNANIVYAGPASGAAAAPTFRSLVALDIPSGGGSPLTTKGDIYVYSTVNTRLPVGSNNQTLVALSSATPGLEWQSHWVLSGTTLSYANLVSMGAQTTGIAALTIQRTADWVDGTSDNAGVDGQIKLIGSSVDTFSRVVLGCNLDGTGFIQAERLGGAYKRFSINPGGGNVQCGVGAAGSPGSTFTVGRSATYTDVDLYAFAIFNSGTPALFLGMGYDSSLGAAFIQAGQAGVSYNRTLLLQPNAGTVGIGTIGTSLERLQISGNFKLETAGNGILIKEGTNATMGTATLAGGTVVVNTTKVTANSRIFLTINGGTLLNVGSTYVSARTAGTSFTITSTNVLDASNVAWVILEPG